MKQKVGGKIALILVVLALSVWFAFFKDVDVMSSIANKKVTYFMKKPEVLNGVTQKAEKVDKFNLGLDLKGGVYIVIKATPLQDVTKTTTGTAVTTREVTTEVMDTLQEIMEKRINKLGVSEPVIQKSGTDRLIIEIPGIKNPDDAINMMG